MKKQLVIFMMLIFLLAISTVIGAFLTSGNKRDDVFEIGEVKVEIIAYFERIDALGNVIETKISDIDYKLNEDQTKFGVVHINISNPNDIQYFDNFKVDINVKSSVDTYFRIAPYEQFTLRYENNGVITEVALPRDTYEPFNYDTTSFFDNRLKDGFFYYKNTVKRIDESTPLTITFINRLPLNEHYPQYDPKYNLQIGFMIEAVQAHLGPQNNWGLLTPPWDDEGTWEELS